MHSQQTEESGKMSMMGLAFELGYLIAIPLVVFALAGRYADMRFGTAPFLLLLGMALALGTSLWLIARKIKAALDVVSETKETSTPDSSQKI